MPRATRGIRLIKFARHNSGTALPRATLPTLLARAALLLLVASFSDCTCGGNYPLANSGAALQPQAASLRMSANLFPYIQQNLEQILRSNFPVDPTGEYIVIYLPEATDSSADVFCDEFNEYHGQVPACTYTMRARDGCIGPGEQDANGKCQPDLGHPRETYRSYLRIKVQDLVAHFNLFMEAPGGDDSGGFRLQIIDVPIDVSLGLFVNADKLAGITGLGHVACLFQTTPGAAATLNLHELDVSVQPSIQDVNGVPTLFATSMVRHIDLQGLALSAAPLSADPACAPSNSSLSCADTCNIANDVLTFGDGAYNAINDFLQPVIPYLATPLANAALGFLWNKPLQFGGAIPTKGISVVPPGVGTDLQMLASAEDGAFAVTQPDVSDSTTTGMDLPMSIGAYAVPSACAPYVAPLPAYSSGMPAFSGAITVHTADGTPVQESYHLGMALSESFLNQMAYAARSSGLMCLTVGSNENGLLATGSFVPTAGLLFLIAPEFSTLADADAPIFFRLTPGDAPIVQLGDPNATGGTDDEGNPLTPSMINMRLNGLGIEAHLFSYDRYIRVLQLNVDLDVGISLHPTSDGQLNLSLDHVLAENVQNSFNPILPGLQLEAITKVVFQLVAQVLGSSGLTFQLPINDALQKSLGANLQMRILDIRRDGPDNGVLAAYVRVCGPADMADPTNVVCYTGSSPVRDALVVTLASAPGLYNPSVDPRVLALHSDSTPSGHVRVQIDGATRVQVAVDGPLYGPAQTVDSAGGIVVVDPRLKILGHHVLQVRNLSDRGVVDNSGVVGTLNVLVDPEHPTLSLKGRQLIAHDLVTPLEQLTFKSGDRTMSWSEAQTFADTAPTGTELVAIDEAGNASAPITLDLGAETSSPAAHGCSQAGPDGLLLTLAALAFALSKMNGTRRRDS